MPKRPSFQFYPSDWLRDTALRSCSTGARGLWIDMICYMHEGNPYGHLKVGDKVIHANNLARMVGETLEVVEGWLKELQQAGVFDLTSDSVICSRRMIRDENLRQIRASGGKLGGNPALMDKGKVNHKVIEEDKQNPTPSSSSSSSVTPLSPPTPTLEEFLAWANRCSLPADIAEAWFDRANSRKFTFEGYWTDRDGRAITDWRREIASYAKYRAAKQAEIAHRSSSKALIKPRGVWDAKQGIDALKAKLERMKGDPRNRRQKADCPWETEWKEEAKAEVGRIREKIRELEGVVAA